MSMQARHSNDEIRRLIAIREPAKPSQPSQVSRGSDRQALRAALISLRNDGLTLWYCFNSTTTTAAPAMPYLGIDIPTPTGPEAFDSSGRLTTPIIIRFGCPRAQIPELRTHCQTLLRRHGLRVDAGPGYSLRIQP